MITRDKQQERLNIIAKNLKQLMKKRKISQPKLSRAIHVPYHTLVHWTHATREPRGKNIIKLCDFFHITYSQLIEPDNVYNLYKSVKWLPVIGDNTDGINGTPHVYGKKPTIADSTGKLVWIKYNRPNMRPLIPQGSLVLVRGQNTVKDGEISVVSTPKHHIFFYLVHKLDDKTFLFSEKTKLAPIPLGNGFKIIGKALTFERTLPQVAMVAKNKKK